MKICFTKQEQKSAIEKTLTRIVEAKEKKGSFCLNSPCDFSPEEIAQKKDLVSMSKSTSQWNNKSRVATWEKRFFCVSLWWKLRKLDNHHSILNCAQTGIFIMAQESFMDTFSELTSFSSNPSPSFKCWIKRRSVLEAWTSCTYLWWTVNETREALFFIKWVLRQIWDVSHLVSVPKK